MAFFLSGVGSAVTKARRTRRSILDRVPAGFLNVRLPGPLPATRGRVSRPRVSRPFRPVTTPRPITHTPLVQEVQTARRPREEVGPTSRRALDVQLRSLSQLSARGQISPGKFKAEVRRARNAALRFL